MTSKPTVLSLYTGAGGLDYGFEAAGYRTSVAIEFDADSCRTLRASRPWPVIERSIFDVATDEMLEASGRKQGEIDVVVGGPPCQPFSKSGYWATGDSPRLNDPRANTLSAFLRVVEEARPRVLLLENVTGLAYQGKDDGLRLLLSGLEGINRRTRSRYRPVFGVLNAAEFGVPQLRERFFLVAARDGGRFRFPFPTHGPKRSGLDLLGGPGVEAYRTAWDAIGDLHATSGEEDLAVGGKWASLLPSIPEGQNYLWHTERGGGRPLFGWRRRYWTFLLKLAKSKPSWTIQAQPGPAVGPFHWTSRRLSTRELCRLQTFPDNVVVTGGRMAAQRQIGNAVPSLLAEVLAREIRTQLLGLRSWSERLQLMPAVRVPVPAPEITLPVPHEYRHLEGCHSPHPGTGLGHRSRRARTVETL